MFDGSEFVAARGDGFTNESGLEVLLTAESVSVSCVTDVLGFIIH